MLCDEQEPAQNGSKILARYGSYCERRLGRLIKVVHFKTTNTTTTTTSTVVVVMMMMMMMMMMTMMAMAMLMKTSLKALDQRTVENI
jgi:hypothetical protein